ncbi:CPXV166 protein, partial [Monkeypox virus]
MTSILNT